MPVFYVGLCWSHINPVPFTPALNSTFPTSLAISLPTSSPPPPGVVGLREVYEDEEDLHLIMELCQGGDWFEHLIKHGR